MTSQELANYFKVSHSTITTNFPKFAAKQLSNGYLISKIGKGSKADYSVEKVEPQTVNSNYFSSRPTTITIEDLEGEIWIPLFCEPKEYSISNYGRIKNNKTGKLNNPTITSQGYLITSIKNKNYRVHRLVLQSFDPQDNYDELTVDHINGIRNDNRLENLIWATNEQNTFAMLSNRAELNKELTRIIQKYGYEETLARLRSL